MEDWKTIHEMIATFYSMRPHLYYEMFDVLHRAFGRLKKIQNVNLGIPLPPGPSPGWQTLRCWGAQ